MTREPLSWRHMPVSDADSCPFLKAIRLFATQQNDIEAVLLWGGCAANVALQWQRKTRTFFGVHDVEMFIIVDGRIVGSRSALSCKEPSISLGRVTLPVGGLQLSETKSSMSPLEFQRERIGLRDGDLYLNNIAVLINPSEERLSFLVPSAIEPAIFGSSECDQIKPFDLPEDRSLALRRLSRNVSKLLRFSVLAGQAPSHADAVSLARIADASISGSGPSAIGQTQVYAQVLLESYVRFAPLAFLNGCATHAQALARMLAAPEFRSIWAAAFRGPLIPSTAGDLGSGLLEDLEQAFVAYVIPEWRASARDFSADHDGALYPAISPTGAAGQSRENMSLSHSRP